MSAERILQIRERLEAALHPTALEIIDEGHKHVGHAGEGQGHYLVRISSAAFAGKTSIQQHRLVYAAVDDLMGNGIHALKIDVKP